MNAPISQYLTRNDIPYRHSWACSQNCSGVADGFLSSGGSVFTIPSGSLETGLVRLIQLFWKREEVEAQKFQVTYKQTYVMLTYLSYIFRCQRQTYGFSLNVSKGSVDADVAYGLIRSAVKTVQVEVRTNRRKGGFEVCGSFLRDEPKKGCVDLFHIFCKTVLHLIQTLHSANKWCGLSAIHYICSAGFPMLFW